MKLALVIPALLFATALQAQTKPVKVLVDQVDSDGLPVRSDLIARLNASPKHSLVSDNSFDVEVQITCLVTAPSPGLACSYVFVYDEIGIPLVLTSGVVIGSTAENISKNIFAAFCESTSADQMDKAESISVAKWRGIIKAQQEIDASAKPQKGDGTITPEKHKSAKVSVAIGFEAV
jgi:hypothetical protein